MDVKDVVKLNIHIQLKVRDISNLDFNPLYNNI
jgi:hypothetical protein